MKSTPRPSKRSVGRPRAFDREHALDTALDLFWRYGYNGTSLPQLTAAMGISPPSFYAAFGSKETLYRATLQRYLEKYNHFMDGLLDPNTHARDAIAKGLLAAAEQFTDPTHAPGCMISSAELHTTPESQGLAELLTGLRHAAQQWVYDRIEAARNAGELTATTDTASLAAYFATIIQGMAIQAHDGADTTTLQHIATLAMHAWPNG